VVGTGLFLNMRPTVVIQHPGVIEVREDGRATEPGPNVVV
jgi:hypothetical protein